jgi:hypothetical protein
MIFYSQREKIQIEELEEHLQQRNVMLARVGRLMQDVNLVVKDMNVEI